MTNRCVFDRLFILFPEERAYQLEVPSCWRNRVFRHLRSIVPILGCVYPRKALAIFPAGIAVYRSNLTYVGHSDFRI